MKPASRHDVMAALTVTFLAIPQGLAYALIADLPPVVGLYAATLPAIIGSLTRSSRFVISGPTNALSLLVGGTVGAVAASQGASPVEVAVALAFGIGTIQVLAGIFRLGALVDYISAPVVLGYITGAAVLIGMGQLGHLTGTPMERGHLPHQLSTWWGGLGDTHLPTLCVGLGTFCLVLMVRKWNRSWPSALIAVGATTLCSFAFGFQEMGIRVVADLSVVQAALPPLTLPRFSLVLVVLPIALAGTVLSLVESTAVGRSIASKTGERLDSSQEFLGQGLANLSAAFCGGYPVSGSLSRSSLNWKAGAKTPWAGAFSGLLVLILVWTAGPFVNLVPLTSLGGLLLVIAWELLDGSRMAATLKSNWGDALAFVCTVVGTWTVSLDKAIFIGVGISIVLFLRRARLLVVGNLEVNAAGQLQESSPDQPSTRCPSIRVLHIEGSLFFGAAGELMGALDLATEDPAVRALVVRLKRTQGLDITTAQVFAQKSELLRTEQRTLILVGMRSETMKILNRTGASRRIGRENLFPTETAWFQAMDHALHHALEKTKDHDHDQHGPCPIESYLDARKSS